MTSARRFEKEGLKERQILNAVIMALCATGMDQMVSKIPNIYREHDKSGRLDIYQILLLVKEEIGALSRGERRSFWSRIGGYVSNNAWQIPFFLDVRREFRADGVARDNSSCRCLDRFDRFYSILTCNKLGACCASIIARIWFKSLLFREGDRG
jgi:hypothetical protein